MVKVAYSHLSEKLNTNQITGEVLQKLAKYVEFMTQRNFPGANAIQTVRKKYYYYYYYM